MELQTKLFEIFSKMLQYLILGDQLIFGIQLFKYMTTFEITSIRVLVSDCCLMPSEDFFRNITRKKITFDEMMMYALY
jgi:hypothetical protein